MEAPELKPCPFCGGEAEWHCMGDGMVPTIIGCTNCGAVIESWDTSNHCRAWNTRAPDPDLEAHIGAVLEQAAKACEAEVDFPLDDWDKGRNCGYRGAADDIRNLRPDALQALERVRREARVEGMRAVIEAANRYGVVVVDDVEALIEAERGKP